jgi:hypothetical protein
MARGSQFQRLIRVLGRDHGYASSNGFKSPARFRVIIVLEHIGVALRSNLAADRGRFHDQAETGSIQTDPEIGRALRSRQDIRLYDPHAWPSGKPMVVSRRSEPIIALRSAAADGQPNVVIAVGKTEINRSMEDQDFVQHEAAEPGRCNWRGWN